MLSEGEHIEVDYDAMRKAVIFNLREARTLLERYTQSSPRTFNEFLQMASCPGEFRVRQFIANYAKTPEIMLKVEPYLKKWLAEETDEFARNAVQGALDSAKSSRQTKAPVKPPADLVESYRYVADRLCHRVRNALLPNSTILMKLDKAIEALEDARAKTELQTTSRLLREGFRSLSRVVEMETEDDYFQWQSVDLPSWLEKMNLSFSTKRQALSFVTKRTPEAAAFVVRASDFWLDIVFWNIWQNVLELHGSSSTITANFERSEGKVKLTIVDAGLGFPPEFAEFFFNHPFSSLGGQRGRGLLEIQDAMRKLQGTVKLVDVGGLRLRLFFPADR